MPGTRSLNVKMSARVRMIALAALLAIVLPILASCGGATPAPATNPTAALPTAAAQTQPTAAAQPTAAPQPTAAAQPTSAPAASPTEEIFEPGKPISLRHLNFGIVNHLYYTDRERVLTLDGIAGFDWVRQQVVWKDIEGPQGVYAWDELDKIVAGVAAHKF